MRLLLKISGGTFIKSTQIYFLYILKTEYYIEEVTEANALIFLP